MIKLYQFEYCPYCANVRAVLRQLGLKYQAIEVDPRHKPQVVMEENGGLVPVLDDHGKIVVESTVIIEYLKRKYGKK